VFDSKLKFSFYIILHQKGYENQNLVITKQKGEAGQHLKQLNNIYMCLLLQRISSQTDALNKSHGIEASYITVHSYDILVINTHPQTLVITKILYSNIVIPITIT